MSWMYDEYLKEHIMNVEKGLHWFLDNLDLTSEEREAVRSAIMDGHHDQSKYEKFEYDAYDAYFYGGNRSFKVVQTFNYAWLHHIHHNPHHWQYWVLVNDDEKEGTVALDMPLRYIFEMIADWWTFSWKSGNLTEIFEWYREHEGRIIFHKNTLKTVKSILKRMKEKLTEEEEKRETDGGLEVTVSIEHSDVKPEENDKQYGVPEQKKFPLPDADHVKSAIRFFNYVDPKYEKELAEAILEKLDEYGMVLGEDITVGDENRFKNYIPKEEQDEVE